MRKAALMSAPTQASHQVFVSLRDAVLTGQHPMGTWLREEVLANALGVSRTPIRDAIRRLADEGLVDLYPHRGARVRVWSPEMVQERSEVRALLEGHAAYRAAAVITSEDLARVNALAQEMFALSQHDVDTLKARRELHLQFHDIVRVSAGTLLRDLLSGAVQMPRVGLSYGEYPAALLERSLSQHLELVEALRVRDGAWARSIMEAHVHSAGNFLVTYVASNFQSDGAWGAAGATPSRVQSEPSQASALANLPRRSPR
jgi:DNA-binding GntR family transcriptional regulator